MDHRLDPAYLSVADYGASYGLSPKTVHKLKDAGLLDYWQIGPRLVRIKNQPPSDGQVRFPKTRTA